MAKAERIPPTPPAPLYRLELTEKEAQMVKALVGRVLGDHQHVSSSVYNALQSVGVYGGYDTEGGRNFTVVSR